MAARFSSRVLLNGALIALVFAYPAFSCPHGNERSYADSQQQQSPPEKSKAERCKRSENRTPSKDCPDGGERLPQDKRSPLDSIPPLSPLVA